MGAMQLAVVALGAISAIATAAALYFRIVVYNQAFAAGFKAAQLEASERETANAKQRTRIDVATGKLGSDELESELHKNSRD